MRQRGASENALEGAGLVELLAAEQNRGASSFSGTTAVKKEAVETVALSLKILAGRPTVPLASNV